MTITSAPAETPPTAPGRRPGRVALTVLIWLLIAPALLWVIVRATGWDRGPLVQLLAYTPYVAAWSVLPALLALVTRRWTAASVALAVVLLFALLVVPRAIPGGRGPSTGVRLNVMTSNMLFGGADAEQIVGLVREHDIAVLAVQEFTTDGKQALAKAGLEELLPYTSFADEPGASGSGVYSRYPIAGAGHHRVGGGFLQAYGTVQPPHAAPILVESAHPRAPSDLSLNRVWRSDLAAEPGTGPDGTPRILLGDFNATLDHAPLRRLIARGYRDAGAATGRGLTATWPYFAHRGIPWVTLDHVLVDKRIGVRDMSVHRITDSDHRAVIAGLTVPAA
ncbi:endonuclease/exonuclease/phosphatase family protein [Actinoplanes sp. CA-142083]|uniref:endonuclease/exonuclease/phosphatase family protein n=1 Tax=Actinoplanes sp. CA-142083 TaxID=3239903 RepID=UPI003D8BB0DC